MSWYDWFWWGSIVPPSKPQLVSITVEQPMKVFRYKFTLAEPAEQVTRKAIVKIDGATEEIQIENNELTQDFQEDAVVSVSFVDTDTSGNDSDPADVLVDVFITDIVPPMPPTVTLAVTQVEVVDESESDDSDTPSEDDNTGDNESGTDSSPSDEGNGDSETALE